jgi:hypothetical protein
VACKTGGGGGRRFILELIDRAVMVRDSLRWRGPAAGVEK